MQTPASSDGDVEVHATPDPDGTPITDRVLGGIRTANRWLHYVAGFVLLGVMSLTVVHIVGRAFFNAPVAGTVELTRMAMILVVYLGFGYAEDRGDHISVDLLHEKLGRRAQLALTAFSGALGFVVIAVLGWQLYQYAGVLDEGGYVTSILSIPQGPVALVGVAGTILFVLALATTAVLGIRAIRNERP